jgi:DNA-directed RNA polymerase subunit M/transcription elongation factor TFIIS
MSEIVHCPKCHSAVSVQAKQTGQRVQCPSCLKQFLAPSTLGDSGASVEDDDWLTLDDSPAPDGTPGPIAPAPVPTSESEEDRFGFESTEETPIEVAATDDLFAGLPPVDLSVATVSQNRSTPLEAQTIGAEEEFRVHCPVCGSVLYAKAKQSGEMIKCSDCYSEVRVPKPPKKQVQAKPPAEAATFNLSETDGPRRREDPYKKSADELLKEAAREPEEASRPAYDGPSMSGWLKSIFGIFLDPGVIIHFVGLSLLLAIPAALTFAIPLFALGMIPLALIGITLTVACGFAILFGVANEHERIEEWPTVDPTGWFEPFSLVLAATAIAVGPAYVVAQVLSAPPAIAIGLVMLSVYATFPIILLSMLDMQSITSPFSPDVGKSITRCQEDWGAFYFSAGFLFACLFAYFNLCPYTTSSVAIGVVLSIAVAFIYFALLGRLALAIGNVVELTALDRPSEEEETD